MSDNRKSELPGTGDLDETETQEPGASPIPTAMSMRADEDAIGPGIMPLDRAAWKTQLHLSNFINAYYEFRDVESLQLGRRILVVGPGQGLGVAVLRWRGFDVTTLDVDSTFSPDVIGSVHDMHQLEDGAYDVVIASHVLEHLPVCHLDAALREMARVGRSSLIFLPLAGRHAQIRLKPGIRNIDVSLELDVFNPAHQPDGATPRYMQGMHYWEVGMRGFRVADLITRFESYFVIRHHYRNRDWLPSYNFVLLSREHDRHAES